MIMNKVKFYVLFTALLSSLCAHGAPQSITELCSEYHNTQIYTINDKILSYTESMAGKREMVIITFKSGATFQVEVPGSQHIDSQKKAIERMKDTLRITYLTETKIDKLCVWNNKTPNSIAAISMEKGLQGGGGGIEKGRYNTKYNYLKRMEKYYPNAM
nr:LTB.Etx fusion protein [synthetic construct]